MSHYNYILRDGFTESRASALPGLLPAFAALGLLASTAFAGDAALQFMPESFSGAVWNPRHGGSALSSEHAATNGWSLAWKVGGAIRFDAATSPLAFPDAATGRVFRALAAVTCEEAVDHATLFDASCSVRFIPLPFPGNERTFYESQLANAVALAFNGTATNLYPSASGIQLVEAAFEPPCPLNEIYIGGTPATAAWGQGWRGGVAELILLVDAPTDDQLNAIRRYLALKYDLAVPTESDGGIVGTLAAMGVDSCGLFTPVFVVR
ncbi:MAG: hypothetical protein ACOX9C_05880 [Kiritimatiellia bacterium]|jgi:hypothetical protein